MEEDIRTFLESPSSLELASEIDLVKTHKSRNKKRGKQPSCIPFRSVYAQTDLSKLTERQRILALKFQTNKLQVNSLFLAVNELAVPNKDRINSGNLNCKECSLDSANLLEFLEWLAARHGCSKHAKILELRDQQKLLMDERSCICRRERKLYVEATKMANYSCCAGQLF